MTDNEIRMALGLCTSEHLGCEDGCPYADSVCCRSDLLKDVIDLIKRLQKENEKNKNIIRIADKTIATQQAEIERLSTLANLGNMRANDYRVMRDRALKAEKEIERLCTEIDELIIAKDLLFDEAEALIKNAKAEAAKEFAEMLKELFPSDNEPYQSWEIHAGVNNIIFLHFK